MGRIIMGTGSYASEPYYLEKYYVNLYSIEELCYVLVKNVELLDQDIMQTELIKWIDVQCGLNQLAHSLYTIVNQNCTTVAFVGTILEYVNLFPEQLIADAEEIIRNNEGLSPFERKKAKVDYLLSGHKYVLAMEEYYTLLKQLPDNEEVLRARIFYNMGVASAQLFHFAQAAYWFKEAYEILKEEESLLRYLAAVRLQLKDEKYIAFIAQHPEYHVASLKVEQMMNRAVGEYEGTDENRMLFTLQVCKEEGSSTAVEYYQEIDKLTEKLKEQYREFVS